MNWEHLQSDWDQFKGLLHAEWDKLTGDDVEAINGDRQRMSHLVQKRYGKRPEEADGEIERWLARH